MKQNLLLTTICLALLSGVACTPKQHKNPLNKTITGTGKAVSNKAVDQITATNKNCLPLFKLIQQLKAQKDDSFNIFVSDMDFGQVSAQGLNFNPADDLTRKLALSKKMPTLIESRFGSDLENSGIAKYLAVTGEDQDPCGTVTFKSADAAKPQVFTVSGIQKVGDKVIGTPGKVTLIDTDGREARVYTQKNDQLTISVYSQGDVPACPDGKDTPMTTRITYVVNFASALENVELKIGFAKLLQSVFTRVPIAIADQIKALSGKPAIQGQTPTRPQVSASGIKLTPSALFQMMLNIKGQINDIQCK